MSTVEETFNRLREEPPVVNKCGTKRWIKNGLKHRDFDLPAVIYTDGEKQWFKNGKLHRDNGPAVIWANGTKRWYKNGKFIHGLPDWKVT